jgi:tRNA(adenine34) deaminase
MSQHDVDVAMMRRCIALSASASRHELPIACLVCDGEDVLGGGTNAVRQTGDVTRHAEIVALTAAQQGQGRRRLTRATLYATVEPCPMCSFAMRELNIARVIYALGSPVMGGVSKWNVMRDTGLSDVIPEVFGPVPEVVAGLLSTEAAGVWRTWNPLIWAFIEQRRCFVAGSAEASGVHMSAVPSHAGWLHSLFAMNTD